MKFQSVLEQFEDTRVFNFHIVVNESIANQFIEGEDRRIVCTLNDKETIHAALMPRHGDYFILINNKVKKSLDLELGDNVEVRLEKETSAYGMPMPEEFQALLEQDVKGSEYFHLLTPGKQRNLIYLVSKVKNTDSRMTKSLAIVDHLKDVSGALDFKILNQKIKEYNQNAKLKF